eukprot:scaffold258670_cov47-Prasinocladus_malaysianus.AAC.1
MHGRFTTNYPHRQVRESDKLVGENPNSHVWSGGCQLFHQGEGNGSWGPRSQEGDVPFQGV